MLFIITCHSYAHIQINTRNYPFGENQTHLWQMKEQLPGINISFYL